MGNWWKCQILRNSIAISLFIKGDIVFAKNEDGFVTLFDGRREVAIPKMHVKILKLLDRLSLKETTLIELDYQLKKAAKLYWDPSTRWD
jgi:hypothetical protein